MTTQTNFHNPTRIRVEDFSRIAPTSSVAVTIDFTDAQGSTTTIFLTAEEFDTLCHEINHLRRKLT